MLELHPEILRKNGRNEFAVLPYEEYVALRELLDDVRDILELRQAKQSDGDAPGRPLEDVLRELGLDQPPDHG